MRYDEKSGRIFIGVREFVATARRGMPGEVGFDEEEPEFSEGSRAALSELAPEASPRLVSYDFEARGLAFRLSGRIADLSGGLLTHLAETRRSPEKPTRAELAQARGEGFLLAWLAAAEGEVPTKLRLILCRENGGESSVREEDLDKGALERFFKRCSTLVSLFGAPEIERVTERVPSMKALKFPYGRMRPGQKEFVQESYRTFCRGGTLFASAPTGTGKTVSALFPAVRAMGDGRCEKIFYFTPKTTTARAAEECLLKMAEKGGKILACILSSKERSCERKMVCRDGKEFCPLAKNNRIAEAALALYGLHKPVISLPDFRAAANAFGVCPYELSLTYAELCDVVVCDLNYLFDPQVYIRRFFTAGGEYLFLIDEAHNLPDRARETYSAEIAEEFFLSPNDSPLGEFSDLRGTADGMARAFRDLLFPYLKDEMRNDPQGKKIGATHLSYLPDGLPELIGEVIGLAEEELSVNFGAKDEEKNARLRFLRNYLYEARKFADALRRFDGGHRLFLFYENDRVRAKVFCVDPSAPIAERLSLGRATLFFSGTLTPLEYYRASLGGDRTAGMLSVGTPFDKDNLAIAVVDKVSTRYNEREKTLVSLCRLIGAAAYTKPGKYMIFSPSFAYSDALCKQFIALNPKARVMQQTQNMTAEEKRAFLSAFERGKPDEMLIGFCVMGGIYSEGIDLAGDRLIGAVVVGIGIPALSFEREAIAEYYDEKYEMGQAYAYLYPGMNRVFQAAGRVIRTDTDRGIVVLIDDRFDDPLYRKTAPDLFSGMQFFSEPGRLHMFLQHFWERCEKEEKERKAKEEARGKTEES